MVSKGYMAWSTIFALVFSAIVHRLLNLFNHKDTRRREHENDRRWMVTWKAKGLEEGNPRDGENAEQQPATIMQALHD